ncbi:MAG: phosphate acyltransferase PlsX [Elusimicrobia bacterium]|nr:phosphate acyltransferase PlsX [Elusimicrobiota bacterium]
MRIALDAAGGDFGLAPNVEGAVQAASGLGCRVCLVGPAEALRRELSARGIAPGDGRFEVVDAPELIAMEEDPVRACREKPKASINVAANLVSEGRADALVSAGHSGATMVASLWALKRLPGVLRPAIVCPIPTARGTSVLLDAGANTECRPWHLLQFAMMGVLYARHVLKMEHPSVGILSNGEEETKGNELVREAVPLLKYSGLNFYGPIEGRDIAAGTVDVVVCDGFTGNICIKLMEGVARVLMSQLKDEIGRGALSKLGGLLIRPAARSVKRRMSDEEYGGAPLLGVGGTAIICHGKSSPRAIFNAHRVAKELVEAGANDRIRAALEGLKSSLEMTKAVD